MPRGESGQFDVVVIGAGSAGIAAAESARAHGARVCLVERERVLGGECPRWACVPTKTLLRSASLYHAMRNADDYGISVSGLRFRFSDIARRRKRIVDTVTGHGKHLAERMEDIGVTIVSGTARFTDAHTVLVGRRRIRAAAFVIATGSEDMLPPIAGLSSVPYAVSRDAIGLRHLPSSVVIVGGGPVGAEFATYFGLLGSTVTVVEAGSRILPREDDEIAALATATLRGHGVRIHEHTRVLSVGAKGKRIRVTLQTGDRPRTTMTTAMLLVAAGRRPRVGQLGLEEVGVRFDAHRRVRVDKDGRTNLRHVFVAGDAAGGMQFTHVAHAQGTRAGALAAGAVVPRATVENVVPRVTFVVPEIASIGMTEKEARKAVRRVRVARYPVGALSRAVIDGKRDGLVKIIIGPKGKILGGHIMGAHAGEVLHEIALAMHAGIPFDQMTALMHAFPSYSEGIPASASFLS